MQHSNFQPSVFKRTWLAYRICKLQTAASAVGCGWMWSEKLNNRRSDGGMTGDVCYRICTIDRSVFKIIWPTPPPFHRTKSTGENEHLCHHVSSRTFNKFSCYQFMFTLNQKYKYKSFWRLCQLSNWLSHFPFDQWFSQMMGLDIRKAWPQLFHLKNKNKNKKWGL